MAASGRQRGSAAWVGAQQPWLGAPAPAPAEPCSWVAAGAGPETEQRGPWRESRAWLSTRGTAVRATLARAGGGRRFWLGPPGSATPARGSLVGPVSAEVQGGSMRAQSKRRGAAAAGWQAGFLVRSAEEATVQLGRWHQRGSNGGQLWAAFCSPFSLSLFCAGARQQQSKRRGQAAACCFADTLPPPANQPPPARPPPKLLCKQHACLLCLRCRCQSNKGVVLNNTSCFGFF